MNDIITAHVLLPGFKTDFFILCHYFRLNIIQSLKLCGARKEKNLYILKLYILFKGLAGVYYTALYMQPAVPTTVLLWTLYHLQINTYWNWPRYLCGNWQPCHFAGEQRLERKFHIIQISVNHLFISLTSSQTKGGNIFKSFALHFKKSYHWKKWLKKLLLSSREHTPVRNLIFLTHTNCNFIRNFPRYMTRAKALKPFKKRSVAWHSTVAILPSVLYSMVAEILKQLDKHICPIDRKEK